MMRVPLFPLKINNFKQMREGTVIILFNKKPKGLWMEGISRL